MQNRKNKQKKNKKTCAIAITVIFFAFLISCTTTYNSVSTKWNLSSIYNPSKSTIHPAYKIYHNNDNTSLLYIKIFTNELLFQPVGTIGNDISEIKVSYTLYETGKNSNSIADSGSYNFTIPEKTTSSYTINQIPIKAEIGKSYKLKVITRDLFRRSFNLSFIDIEKKEDFGQQFFNLTSVDGIPIFKNVIIGNTAFRVSHMNQESDKLYIKYFFNDTRLPKPSFSTDPDETSYKTFDSLFVIEYNPNQALSLAYEGMYYIQFDTGSSEGVSISRFKQSFPKTLTPEDMVEPLLYLLTTGEYNTIRTNSNLKLAVDNFWINAGGSTDRGREMIKIFYNRVYVANYYFTNTKPGWKTDRGMVYIVYGSPHSLKKTSDSEIWYYYRKGSGESITFTFNYKPTEYHLNQYILERSESHTWHWREAVYSWTNGEIFLLD